MRVSAKTRYVMQAMVDVAMQGGGSPVALRQVARRQDISQGYLGQILMQLRAAGLVKSVRVAVGGFVMGRSPSYIRMAKSSEVFEGQIDLIGCATDVGSCSRSVSCAVRQVWVEVGNCMKKVLDSVTLQDVAELQATKDTDSTPAEDK